ncbi:MAG: fasciclin domain-containing protein [Ilumatobacteraceae bacterium]|jgi:uncharacterized surface protein with fasciclin (FAS1) repeats
MKNNRKRIRIRMGIALATLAGTVAVAGPVSAASGPSTQTIADILLADSAKDNAEGFDRNWHDYDIVTQAVLLFPDLVAAASDPKANLTVLAPNDAAFRTLVQDLTKKRPRTEADTFAAIAGLGTDTVKTVLQYHIVGSRLSPSAVLSSNNAVITPLAGGTWTVKVRNPKVAFVQFVDNDPTDRSPFLNRINVGGGELANGFIHGIEKVLRPIDL